MRKCAEKDNALKMPAMAPTRVPRAATARHAQPLTPSHTLYPRQRCRQFAAFLRRCLFYFFARLRRHHARHIPV